MIEIVTTVKKSKKKVIPHYLLTYNYMIGDANGDTTEQVILSKDNPYIEKYCKLLNKLKAPSGHWGVILDSEHLDKCLKEKQLSKKDHEFLTYLMFEDYDFDEDEDDYDPDAKALEYFKTEENVEFSREFYDGVRAEAQYSFLVFQGVYLDYVDEDGIKYTTKFKG